MPATNAKFRPLLAAAIRNDADFAKLRYPLLVSPKIDGIRCILTENGAVTRSLKRFPNNYIHRLFLDLIQQCPSLIGLDGEITLGNNTQVTDKDIFNRTQSALMSFEGKPEITYWVFDRCNKETSSLAFEDRDPLDAPYTLYQQYAPWIRGVVQTSVYNKEELLEQESGCLDLDYEGIMIRNPKARYKYGRSTLLEGTLLKLKREEHGEVQQNEAEIIGYEELMHNDNPQTTNLLGLSTRSSHKENMRGGDTLGAFLCRMVNGPFKDQEVRVGTGNNLTQELRKQIWNARNNFPEERKFITISYQLRGAKDKPRFPVYERSRDIIDIIID